MLSFPPISIPISPFQQFDLLHPFCLCVVPLIHLVKLLQKIGYSDGKSKQ